MLVVTDKGRFLEPQNCFNHCSEKKKKENKTTSYRICVQACAIVQCSNVMSRQVWRGNLQEHLDMPGPTSTNNLVFS